MKFVIGPQTWVSHFPDAAGQRQSPIDIKPVDVKVLNSNAKLHWKYEPETLTEISNTGAAWRVDVKGKGSGNNQEVKIVLQVNFGISSMISCIGKIS